MIYELLNSLGYKHHSFMYYGVEDIGCAYNLQILINIKDRLTDYFSSWSFNTSDASALYDYFFLLEVSKHEEVLSKVQEHIRLGVLPLINDANKWSGSVTSKDLAQWINISSFTFVQNSTNHDHEVLNLLQDLFVKYYAQVTEEAISLYIQKFYYFILSKKGQKFVRKILTSEAFVSLLFSETIVEKMIHQGQVDKIIATFSSASQQNALLSNCIDRFVKKVKDIIVNGSNTLDGIDLVVIQNLLQEVLPFLHKIKNTEFNDLKGIEKNINARVTSWLKINGHKASVEINIKDFFDISAKRKLPKELELLSLTVEYSKKKDSIVSVFDVALDIEEADKLVSEVLSNNSGYFTETEQLHLGVFMQTYKNILWVYQNNAENRNTFFNNLYFEISKISEFHRFPRESFYIDINSLYISSEHVYSSIGSGIEYLRPYLYGQMMLVCSLIEKILRQTLSYKEFSKSGNDFNSFTLGKLLDSPYLQDILGQYQVKYLKYFLLEGKEGQKGLGVRDALAHNFGSMFDYITFDNSLVCLFLLLSVINSIYVSRFFLK